MNVYYRPERRLTAAAVTRWAKRLALIMAICVLGLICTTGVNWLSQQPWGDRGEFFTCDPSGTLTWHTTKSGDILLHCRP